jgi:hypothetical protein
MTNTRTTTTTKTNLYFRALMTLAVLAMMASLLAVLAVKPADAATTFTVNFTGDFEDINVGDGICDAFSVGEACTLRAAIQEANATREADTINFNIPAAFRDPNTGVATISPNSALPPITEQVTIDGYTQPGSSPNTLAVGDNTVLKIELNGGGGDRDGLEITNSSGSVIRGLVVNRFDNGIDILGDSVGNRIEGNFIGTDPTGTIEQGNGFSGVNIRSGSSQTVVGGTTPATRNVISNNQSGIVVFNANASRIQGNYVGTDKSGTKDLGNTAAGVEMIGTTDNTVGGTMVASRNVISGNHRDGLLLIDVQGTTVLGNSIGTDRTGTKDLGNGDAGVEIEHGSFNTVGGASPNTIAFNATNGVQVSSDTINRILSNSTFSNGELGIDLNDDGVTPNDGDDPNTSQVDPDSDTSANNLQNVPVISSAKTSSTAMTISAKLNSQANNSYIVQFFSNPAGTNEGKTFIGKKTVTTDASGNVSFTFKPASKVAAGKNITATATREFFGPLDTSEFSAPRKVVAS